MEHGLFEDDLPARSAGFQKLCYPLEMTNIAIAIEKILNMVIYMALGQSLVALVNIKIAGKWCSPH